MAGVFSRLLSTIKHAWNAFNPASYQVPEHNYGDGMSTGGGSYNYFRPDKIRSSYSAEKTIVASILARLSADVAGIKIAHVQTDADGRYVDDVSSGLNECLKVKANIDQPARMFRQDIALTLFQKGTIAIVPVDTSVDPTTLGSFDILTMRVGVVTEWYPQYVRVSLYNDQKGYREEIVLPKSFIAIVENPFYSVMNEPNSTLQRLVKKLNMLDMADEAVSSGKLDLIIQLPYVVKSEARRQQAVQRRTDLEEQLKGSTYGIAYTDGTEKITQLNRPADNNLLDQVQYLIAQVYTELGLTDTIMNGTADESTMLNYIDRTIKPVVDAITEAMLGSFITKAARSQGQAIMYFRDPFSLVPLSQFADIADTLSRNEIASPNDIRTAIGWKPSKDPKADMMINSNMPQPGIGTSGGSPYPPVAVPSPTPQTALPSASRLAIESGGNSQNGS